MKKNKKGFTLSEVLVTTIIIGVVMAISVKAISTVKASYPSLTYFAYNTVQDFVFITSKLAAPEPKLKDSNNVELPYMTGKCMHQGKIISVLKSDIEYDPPTTIINCRDRASQTGSDRNLFCLSVASLANTAGNINCSNLFSVGRVHGEPSIIINNYDNPNFTTTNGQRFYISKWQFDDSISDLYGYRIIAIDLNGKQRPDSTTSTKPPADTVQFLVLDNAEIFPIGAAADNLVSGGRKVQYLTSKVKGYYMSNNPSRTGNVAPDCYKKINGTQVQVCNWGLVYVKNENGSGASSATPTTFTYREAFCTAQGQGRNVGYNNYCSGIVPHRLCPVSTDPLAFDYCKIENIKPSFRYSLSR